VQRCDDPASVEILRADHLHCIADNLRRSIAAGISLIGIPLLDC
jgi:hypothetical protein